MIILPIPTASLTHFSLKVRVGRMYSKVPDGTTHCGSLPSSLPSAHRRRLLPATNSDPSMHTYRMSAPPAEVTTVWRGGLRMTSSMMERQVFFLWPNTAINYERKELFGRDHGHNTFTAKVINTKFILQHHQNVTSHSIKSLAFHSLLRWKMIQFSLPHWYVLL